VSSEKKRGGAAKTFASVEIQYEVNGLDSLREIRDSTGQPMPHSHNEIEVLLLERGSGTWFLGGQVVTLLPGRLTVFWAVRPHQLIKSSHQMVVNCLTIPLAVFNEWQMPERFAKALLAGHTIQEPDRSQFGMDKRAFHNWHMDLKAPDRNRHKLALLEIEARLGRLATRLPEPDGTEGQSAPVLFNHQYFEKVSQIADYVSRHFAEALTVPDIARAVGMHPTSATKMFKKICGMSLIHYLTQHRILHAQRLLVATDHKILDIALASGYRSASRFYAAYKKFCGDSPQHMRSSFDLRRVLMEPQARVLHVAKARTIQGLAMPAPPAQNQRNSG
jgi:AraC-like DNA-binding protein